MSYSKVLYFFFLGHGRWPFVHSNPKIGFFFSRVAGKIGRKKNQTCFFFQEKFIGHLFGFLMNSIFLIKLGCVFFCGNFVCFFGFFFSWKSSQAIHSWAEKKTGKKKLFIHSFEIPPKIRKNELLRGDKKIQYLWC